MEKYTSLREHNTEFLAGEFGSLHSNVDLEGGFICTRDFKT